MHNITFRPYHRTDHQRLEKIASSARVLMPLPSSQERFGIVDISREFRRYIKQKNDGKFTITKDDPPQGDTLVGFVAFYVRCGDFCGEGIPQNEERIDYAFLNPQYKEVEAMRKQLKEELWKYADAHDPAVLLDLSRPGCSY